MEYASLIPAWLDALLIAPFRWPSSPFAGIWLGSATLAAYCTLLGEVFGALLFLAHHHHFNAAQDDMIRYHNLSVRALHAGNKEAYLAANTIAQENFGKSFFAGATIGISTLWPLPFVLGWMSLRFEGLILYTIPGTDIHAGYVFVLLSAYIAMRIGFARLKKRLPLFRRVEVIRQASRAARGTARPLFNPPPA